MNKPALLEMDMPALRHAVAQAGQPAYRAEQLASWVYGHGETEPAGMTNVPNSLVEAFDILPSRRVATAESKDGTVKCLIEYPDGERVECVLIPDRARQTACLSTQAGCAMGCRFCASGLDGLSRNLSSGEILQQVLHLSQATQAKVTNVVFMGQGEPLANYAATVAAVRALVDPQRFDISARKVTVSTVGLPKAIRKLADEELPITLAISLHAPNDALRQELMPAASKHPVQDVLAAAKDFFASRGREVTLEYVLLADVNDTNVCADGLSRLARGLRCNVNLITYNPVESLPYSPSSTARSREFLGRLTSAGVNAHLRRSRGADLSAACGQLRRRPAGPEV